MTDQWLSTSPAYVLLPVITATIGAGVAAIFMPGPLPRSLLQHFAAGVVFAVVAVELLPDVVRTHSIREVVLGFTLGVLLMLAVRRIANRLARLEDSSGTDEPATAIRPIAKSISLECWLQSESMC